ncbi:hypothetical protein ON010_g11430 [Phytophthora cinnamomi]|nr:hypothetical protein ON010_g11430 [Phytophthora cinnamomi]
MRVSLTKPCVRRDRALPSFSAMFPATTSTQNVSEPPPVGALMTLGGLPPLHQTEVKAIKTEQIDDDNDNDAVGDSNEFGRGS